MSHEEPNKLNQESTPMEEHGSVSSKEKTTESRVLLFNRAADEVIVRGDRLMAERHDPEGLDPKMFHTSEHPSRLKEFGKLLADVFRLSPESRKIINIAFSYHDLVINYELPAPEDILARIKRKRGARSGDQPAGTDGNEALSAREAADELRRINSSRKEPIFSEEQIKTVEWAIDATYPGVDLGPDFKGASFKDYPLYGEIKQKNPEIERVIDLLESKGITKGANFYQPHLEEPLERGEKVLNEVVIVAMSDLGAPGIMNVEDYAAAAEGDKEFWELSVNLREPKTMKRLLEGNDAKDDEDRARVIKAMQQWLHDQTSFVAWQMLRFEKIVYLLGKNGQLDGERERELRKILGNYEKNIMATLEREKEMAEEYERVKAAEGAKAAFVDFARKMNLSKAYKV